MNIEDLCVLIANGLNDAGLDLSIRSAPTKSASYRTLDGWVSVVRVEPTALPLRRTTVQAFIVLGPDLAAAEETFRTIAFPVLDAVEAAVPAAFDLALQPDLTAVGSSGESYAMRVDLTADL